MSSSDGVEWSSIIVENASCFDCLEWSSACDDTGVLCFTEERSTGCTFSLKFGISGGRHGPARKVGIVTEPDVNRWDKFGKKGSKAEYSTSIIAFRCQEGNK